ncbi:MAG: hypothetical protein KDG49_16195, partial [Geminicoccaceae bacterium]|nr:hypothetical protein [Geminicoccaceae bacterium]
MSMKNLFLAGAAVTLLATSAMAAEPTKLTASQMDSVTAGAFNLDLDLALAITGPIRGRNLSTAVPLQSATFNTTNQVTVGTSLVSLRQTSGTAINQLEAVALNNNGRVRLGGT